MPCFLWSEWSMCKNFFKNSYRTLFAETVLNTFGYVGGLQIRA